MAKVIKPLLSKLFQAFFWIPGVPAFYSASGKSFISALAEFLITLFFSLLPLITICGTDYFRTSCDFDFSIIFKYIESGQTFFYVGPIIGGIFYLIITDIRKTSKDENGRSEIPERFWFLTYTILSIISCVIILVLYHIGTLSNSNKVIYTSLIIYAISLYFSFLNTLYTHLSNEYNKHEKEAQNSITSSLNGFTGDN